MEQNKQVQSGPIGSDNAGNLVAQGMAIQQVKTSYATAVTVQHPRDLLDVERRCLKEAALLGEGGYYGWGVGKDKVEGPTVGLAMIAFRNYGNCVIEADAVQDTPTAWIFNFSFIDLETGVTLPRQYRQSKKSIVHGKYDDVRKEDIRYQNGQSRGVRNLIFNMLPKWLTDKMLDKCKAGVREIIEKNIETNGVDHARGRIVRAMLKVGVKEDALVAVVKKPVVAWDVDILVRLNGDLKCIMNGEESGDILFPPIEDKPKDGDKKPLSETLKQKLEEPAPATTTEPEQSNPDQTTPETTEPTKSEQELLKDMDKPELIEAAVSLFDKAVKAGAIIDIQEFTERAVANGVLVNSNISDPSNYKPHLLKFIKRVNEAMDVFKSKAGNQS